MPTRTIGVLGDVVEDVIVWRLEQLRPGTDTRCRVYRRQGGSAANVAVMAAREAPTRFLGSVGSDAAGIWLEQRLRDAGVDVRLQRGSHTGTIVILVDPDGERHMLPDRGASAEITPVASSWLDGLAMLHLTAYSLVGEPTAASARDAAARVRAAGGWISLDVSSAGLIQTVGLSDFDDILAELAPDVLFANEQEAELLEVASRRLARVTVIKRGGDVTTAIHDDQRIDVQPERVIVRDSTGAGDAFAAGFLTAAVDARAFPDFAPELLEGCVRSGHRAAAHVLTTPGAGPADAGY